ARTLEALWWVRRVRTIAPQCRRTARATLLARAVELGQQQENKHMKRFVRAAMAAAAMGLVFGASEAQAQVGFSIGGGPTFAMGDFGDAADMGYHVVGAVRFGLPMIPVGLQAEAMWNRWSVTDVDDANWQTLSGSLNAVINLPT